MDVISWKISSTFSRFSFQDVSTFAFDPSVGPFVVTQSISVLSFLAFLLVNNGYCLWKISFIILLVVQLKIEKGFFLSKSFP